MLFIISKNVHIQKLNKLADILNTEFMPTLFYIQGIRRAVPATSLWSILLNSCLSPLSPLEQDTLVNI